VAVIGNHSFISIACSALCTIGLKSDNSAWAWGRNHVGQLGDGTITNRSSPVAVVGNHSFVEIGSADSVGMGLKAEGSLWTWGDGTVGRLGHNTVANTSSPVQVVGILFRRTTIGSSNGLDSFGLQAYYSNIQGIQNSVGESSVTF
jgi:hypothetical protein